MQTKGSLGFSGKFQGEKQQILNDVKNFSLTEELNFPIVYRRIWSL